MPQDPAADSFGRVNSGVTGRIIPAPATRVRVDLYRDSMRLDTTFSDFNGGFRFSTGAAKQRYELHVEVGPGLEYVEEVDFSMSAPVLVHVQPQGIRKTGVAAVENAAGGGTTISLASLTVPRKAAKEFEKGRGLARKSKFDEALPRFQKAAELYPRYAEALNAVGAVRRAQNRPAEAREAFEQAIAADPNWIEAYLSLCSLLMDERKMQQLLEASNKVVKLDPSLATGYFFQSVAHFWQGRLDEAEKSALEAERNERGRIPQIQLMLARIYQNRGNRAQYARHLRSYLVENPKAANARQLRAELAQLDRK